MIVNRVLSLKELLECLDSNEVKTIRISREAPIYWKRNQEYRSNRRYLDCHEISFIKKGVIAGEVEGRNCMFKANDIFWLNPMTEHSLLWPKNLIYYTFRFNFVDKDERECYLNEPLFLLENRADMEFLFKNLQRCVSDNTEFSPVELKSYIMIFIIESILMKKADEKSKFRTFTDEEMHKIEKYCAERNYIDVSSEDLAELLCYSQDYFTRLFHTTYGKNCRSWLFSSRILASAKTFVNTDLSLSQVAEMYGYEDYYQYSRQFKKVMGVAPTKYKDSILSVEDTPE